LLFLKTINVDKAEKQSPYEAIKPGGIAQQMAVDSFSAFYSERIMAEKNKLFKTVIAHKNNLISTVTA
jgi:hypothetical protein